MLFTHILNGYKLYSSFHWIYKVNSFLSTELAKLLINRDSTLMTIASVFIGIYFTVFTMLATLSRKSTFSLLQENQFKKLLKYIRNAFIAAFTYLILSLFSPLVNQQGWIYSFICISLLTYILLSALRFGLLIYLFLRRDIDHYLKSAKEEELESKRINRLLNDMEKFLEKEKVKEKQNKAMEVSKILEDRRKK